MDCICRCISSLEDEFDKLPNGVNILVAYISVVVIVFVVVVVVVDVAVEEGISTQQQ